MNTDTMENKDQNVDLDTVKKEDTEITSANLPAAETSTHKDGEGRGDKGRRHGGRRPARSHSRIKPEFDQKIISLRRVTRVMAGGRRFNFAVCVVAGNKKGMVGVGQGKASDTPLAIEKAFRDAKKNMIVVNTTKEMSIPHDTRAKFAASIVEIRPAPGKGVLAGSSVRTVFELAGLHHIGSKLLSRSKNPINNAYAAIKALKQLEYTKVRNK